VALADPVRLRQVLLALLDNALRHTPSGGRIGLAAGAAETVAAFGRGQPSAGGSGTGAGGRAGAQGGTKPDRRMVITVTDTGSGIAAEHLPHVFERFYRAENTGGTGGTGLGLAVAKALVEAQGGQMRIESEPGRGTRVIVQLIAAR
jgi:two-component system sensor histidine kinase BaeS